MEQENIQSGSIIDFKVLRRLFSFAKPYMGQFRVLVLLTFLLALLVPSRPLLIQFAIDNKVARGDYDGLVNMIMLLIALLVVQAFVQYAQTYLAGWLGQHVIRDIRIKLYRHLQHLRLKFFDNTPIGRLVTRNISDVETLADVFSEGIAAMAGEILQIIVILVVMFVTDWKLTLVSLSTLPILLFSTYVFKEKIKISFNDVRNAVSNLNSFVQEHISGMSIVQVFNAEKREYQKFENINKEHLKANLKSVMYYSIYYPVAEVIQAAGIGLLVWYGAGNVLLGDLKFGVLVAFIMYIMMFFRPIRMIADRFNTLQMGIVSSSRIMNLLDNETQIDNSDGDVVDTIAGNIEFKRVWFAYKDEDYVLKGISFDVKAGETLALVGATGAGKSSVINLLGRFYEIQNGSITIDGLDITQFDLNCLRKNIGVVLQDVFLFSESIERNITLGNESISHKRVVEAAELVGAREFIERLPGGFDYNVMERGATLSVGQRQLISFVRAMVYDPRIMVLDEATSSVDTETEALIQQAIGKMMHGRTAIVIAHRLSTIQKADKILVLDQGEIKEQGTHETLLDLGGLYTQLYKMQYKNMTT